MKDELIRLGLDRIVPRPGLATCDYVYFATTARADFTITAEFVTTARAIVARAHNSLGQRMPLVQHLRPGQTILLVHGKDGRYAPIFRCAIARSPAPIRTPRYCLEVFCELDAGLAQRLREARYEPDPVLGGFVGIAIDSYQDLRDVRQVVAKPRGNNTLRRWTEVFAHDGLA